MSGPVEVADWEDGGSAMDSVSYDVDLLGTTADTETEDA